MSLVFNIITILLPSVQKICSRGVKIVISIKTLCQLGIHRDKSVVCTHIGLVSGDLMNYIYNKL